MDRDNDKELIAYMLQRFSSAYECNAWLVVNLWPAFRARKDASAAPAAQTCTRRCALDGSLLTVAQADAHEINPGVRERSTGRAYRRVTRKNGSEITYQFRLLDAAGNLTWETLWEVPAPRA